MDEEVLFMEKKFVQRQKKFLISAIFEHYFFGESFKITREFTTLKLKFTISALIVS